jgi:hypothetical protein
MNADEIPTTESLQAARQALRESVESWEKMGGEQQDALIASGWHPGPANESLWLNALDRAARYYRQGLKEILADCGHDKPDIGKIRGWAERSIAAADHELAAADKPADFREGHFCNDCGAWVPGGDEHDCTPADSQEDKKT